MSTLVAPINFDNPLPNGVWDKNTAPGELFADYQDKFTQLEKMTWEVIKNKNKVSPSDKQELLGNYDRFEQTLLKNRPRFLYPHEYYDRIKATRSQEAATQIRSWLCDAFTVTPPVGSLIYQVEEASQNRLASKNLVTFSHECMDDKTHPEAFEGAGVRTEYYCAVVEAGGPVPASFQDLLGGFKKTKRIITKVLDNPRQAPDVFIGVYCFKKRAVEVLSTQMGKQKTNLDFLAEQATLVKNNGLNFEWHP